MRAAENPTATATLPDVTGQADNAQLRSKKTPPDLNPELHCGVKIAPNKQQGAFINSKTNPGSTKPTA